MNGKMTMRPMSLARGDCHEDDDIVIFLGVGRFIVVEAFFRLGCDYEYGTILIYGSFVRIVWHI